MGSSGVRQIRRWECHCSDPPVLLGTFDGEGEIYVSIRKRHYCIKGSVAATCPKCGAVHRLDRGEATPPKG